MDKHGPFIDGFYLSRMVILQSYDTLPGGNHVVDDKHSMNHCGNVQVLEREQAAPRLLCWSQGLKFWPRFSGQRRNYSRILLKVLDEKDSVK
jgi:hypothetical protein